MPLIVRLEPFLLHESAMVRDSVGFHFFESWPKQEQLASLVLEACGRYGEEACLNLLSFGCRFPLSPRSLLETLRVLAESRPPFVELWVSLAPLSIVRGRVELVRSLLSRRATVRLDRRTRFQEMPPWELWRRLEGLCRKLENRAIVRGDLDEIDDLIEALAGLERREDVAERLRTLEEGPSALRWALVELCGAMKLTDVAESLVDLLGSGDDVSARAAVEALARMGSEATVSAVEARYREGSRRFRRFALSVLKAVKLDASALLLRDLAESETDPALRGRIFDALRFHFTRESEILLRRELERPSSWMIPEEIEKALFVFAEIRGAAAIPREDREIYFHIPFEGPDDPCRR